jgi:argininosuccinate lyase
METSAISNKKAFVSSRIDKIDAHIDMLQKSYYISAENSNRISQKLQVFQNLRRRYTQFLMCISQEIYTESQPHGLV